MCTLQIAKKKKKHGIKKIQKKIKYPTVYKTRWENQLVNGNSGTSAKHYKFFYQRVKLILDFKKPNSVCSQRNKNVIWKVIYVLPWVMCPVWIWQVSDGTGP